ncbi:hypothetical protein CLV59_110266 [Chitinophaga dinghuensis]|uniref:Outer membrane protein with beta-barrel domain n=1 Tax=Chitinophaga dinghuensis TaxID=1539050 RepID=A0A327VP94_9BACT|nr:hypothetical protein [Chitinophaga dinghuensis]RAJ75217.1 hypothetical protein CLV59_110266 [Chitinophaga dinghuensis]
MTIKSLSVLLLLMIAATTSTFAQETDSVGTGNHAQDSSSYRGVKGPLLTIAFGKYPKYRKGVYRTNGGDLGLLSFAQVTNNGEHVRNIPRFTYFFNFGTNINKDFGRHFGIFTGLNIKNIGLITKPYDSVKLKQRVYTLGVPLGFKFGDLHRGTFFFFAGAECDLAFNYKEKVFIDGKKESKFNEWFSDRTPLLMPSVFAGMRFAPSFGLKVQYYPQNFFNKDFKTKDKSGNSVYPNQGLDAKLVFVTLSYSFNSHVYKVAHKKTNYVRFKNGNAKMEIEY